MTVNKNMTSIFGLFHVELVKQVHNNVYKVTGFMSNWSNEYM